MDACDVRTTVQQPRFLIRCEMDFTVVWEGSWKQGIPKSPPLAQLFFSGHSFWGVGGGSERVCLLQLCLTVGQKSSIVSFCFPPPPPKRDELGTILFSEAAGVFWGVVKGSQKEDRHVMEPSLKAVVIMYLHRCWQVL